MAYTYNCVLALGAGNTGLTLAAALKNGDGSAAAGSMTTTYLAEHGSLGNYYFQASMPDDHTGYVQFTSGATILIMTPVAPNGSIQYIDQSITEVTELVGDISVNVGASIATAAGAELPEGCEDIAVVRGDSWSITFTGLGDISGRTKLWFTLKSDTSGADTTSLVQIEESAGLIYINGAVAGTAANGDITVSDATLGNITVVLDEVESAKLTPATYYRYDVQVLSGGSVTTLAAGKCAVNADVTRATS